MKQARALNTIIVMREIFNNCFVTDSNSSFTQLSSTTVLSRELKKQYMLK